MTSLPFTLNLHFPPSSVLQLTRQPLPVGSSATRPCLFLTPRVPAHLSIKSHLLHLQETTHGIMPHLLYNYHLIHSLIVTVICSALSMLWNLKCMVGKGNLVYAQKIRWLLRKKKYLSPSVMVWDVMDLFCLLLLPLLCTRRSILCCWCQWVL